MRECSHKFKSETSGGVCRSVFSIQECFSYIQHHLVGRNKIVARSVTLFRGYLEGLSLSLYIYIHVHIYMDYIHHMLLVYLSRQIYIPMYHGKSGIRHSPIYTLSNDPRQNASKSILRKLFCKESYTGNSIFPYRRHGRYRHGYGFSHADCFLLSLYPHCLTSFLLAGFSFNLPMWYHFYWVSSYKCSLHLSNATVPTHLFCPHIIPSPSIYICTFNDLSESLFYESNEGIRYSSVVNILLYSMCRYC